LVLEHAERVVLVPGYMPWRWPRPTTPCARWGCEQAL
jgi:hypothetical protein